MTEVAKLSQAISPPVETESPVNEVISPTKMESRFWDCPICLRPQTADDRTFNAHVDFCLSKQMIKEVSKGSSAMSLPTPSQLRKRKMTSTLGGMAAASRQRRLFN
jgi:DNA polymerase kappa